MPQTTFDNADKYEYQSGFQSHHDTEAVKGALPVGQFSPQKTPFGLYPEKLSGTAFTAPRRNNFQAWVYRRKPSVVHRPFKKSTRLVHPHDELKDLDYLPNQMRWSPFDLQSVIANGLPDTDGAYCEREKTTFVQGIRALGGSGTPVQKHGMAIYIYAANAPMEKEVLYNGDGDFLIVPQCGELDIQTEFGFLHVRPNEICVIPRGIRFNVKQASGNSSELMRGYILEVFDGHFEIPDRGPIGANSLANERDFLAPKASYDTSEASMTDEWTMVFKFNHSFHECVQDHTPFDVVAWTGNYYPYKYDLGRYNTIGSVSYDHPDPSIFTVLTCQSSTPGTAIADFVIFPPRWLCADHTFRPPYFHRNCMSEFMGLISGDYDAKAGDGFAPGGASLHNVFAPHGPDADTYVGATEKLKPTPGLLPDGSDALKPAFVGQGSMAFMFESMFMMGVTKFAVETSHKLQERYNECWAKLADPNQLPVPGKQ